MTIADVKYFFIHQETQQEIHRLAEDARRRSTHTPEKPGKNLVHGAEIEDLRVQLNELIEERERYCDLLSRFFTLDLLRYVGLSTVS